MLITLLCEDKLYKTLLPGKIQGGYWIEDTDLEFADPDRKLVGIEGINDIWQIAAGRRLKLYAPDGSTTVPRLELEEGKMYAVELAKGRKGYIFTESDTQDRCTFVKYAAKTNSTWNIGRSAENQIIIDHPYISSVHAQLSLAGDTWMVSDNDSKNGIYLNEKRLYQSAVLRPGDVLYILGVKMVFGYQFLAINNPGGMVRLNTKDLRHYQPEALLPYEAPEELTEHLYYRSPRFRRGIVPLTLKIDPPAEPDRADDTPLALSLAPSLVMGAASFSSGILAMTTAVRSGGSAASALPTFAMSLAMLAGMVVFPFIMRLRDRKRKGQRELERREKYFRYLQNIRTEIENASKQQQEILHECYPPVLEQMQKDDFFDMVLWSRVIGQQDFLTLRIGIGNIPLQAELTFPEQRFAIVDDILREEVGRFSREQQELAGVPVVCSLMEHRVTGIVGSGQAVSGILHHLLVQIAVLHSYDEVKVIFLCDEAKLKEYGYARWMPHIWDNDFRMRYLAATPEEVRDLSAHFLRMTEQLQGEKMPHYVLISASKSLSDSCAFLAEMLRTHSMECFSYLAVYDELKNLPKECTAVLQISDMQGTMFRYGSTGGGQVRFTVDTMTEKEAAKAVMQAAEYRLDLRSGKYALPDMLPFLDLYKVGKYEHLNIAERWKTSNPAASLQAPVGVNTDGRLFYLDLHEQAHGPHGLIAGMTGSGKSEFIITYILSMAVQYSPEDVAFILIDYKGGGLAGAFEGSQYRLPHLAGTITNLDGSAVNRSLLSIQSELRRRQRMFNEAKQASSEGTMDIYKYQKLYRNGTVREPVPHLLIISDEFAELKSQQPEFMAQLISTARIGRSLGVHLILATQKPSGVVSDQIWANSRFKVCLKVQDRADSMEMLKRPDAAELVETGRFYLQVGYNELFELGQSAWCGAPYVPADTAAEETDERVLLIGRRGNVIEETKPRKNVSDSGQAKKQIVEIVGYLTQIAQEEKLWAQPLWLPELRARITVDQLEEKYHCQGALAFEPVVGELDDPLNQDQRLLTMPLAERGNAVCYGNVGSGKEAFLITVLYSLYRSHTSRELNTYILDFGAETLRMFEDAPQTGGFAVSGEDEKLTALLRMLEQEVRHRKKQFAAAGGDYLSYRRTGRADIPGIVVLINEYANFAEQYEALDDRMCSLTKDCTKYGIYFVITSLSPVGVRYKLQQNFSQVFVLQMNDRTDYTMILGSTGGVYPSRVFGRGICREKEVYEFQTACVTEEEGRIADAVRAFCRTLRQDGQGQARAIPVVPRAVYRRHLGGMKVSFGNVPIGLGADTLEPVCIDLGKGAVGPVFAMSRQDIVAFAEGIAALHQGDSGCELYVIDPGRLLSVEGIDAAHYVAEQPERIIEQLFYITAERHNAYKSSGGAVSADVDMHPVIVLLMGLETVRKLLDNDRRNKLRLMLEKTSGKFGLFYWVMDDYQSSCAYFTESWCGGDGLWIGNGISDQVRIKVNRKDSYAAKKYDFTDGFWVRKARAQPVKLLLSDRFGISAEEEEDDG